MRSSRRSFLENSAVLATGLLAPTRGRARGESAGREEPSPWYANAYRRAVIDMHIPDWDDAFLSKFNAAEYADALVVSRAQSIVCYAMSHVGLFNYPTSVGTPHARFRERDMLAEMVRECHERGVAVVLYVSLIFDRTTADQHPDWRMRAADGKIQGEGGRHGLLCPNHPGYRDYVRAFIQELVGRYDVEGLRCDMTFWPSICHCEHCRERFRMEHDSEVPTVVDWLDPRWVAFQRSRERWLVEFAGVATDAARSARPAITVEHQASTYPLNWMFGVSRALTAENDFLQGDFYGDRLQGSFVRKLLEDLTGHRPFGYETSVSVELRDHTARKPEALLEAKAAAAIADHAAFVFIDAIDPVGTVNPLAHERMGRVFDRLMPYYEHLGGERVSDVGLFYSTESKFDFAGNGASVASPNTADSHTEAAMKAASRLIRCHAPFRVTTSEALAGKLEKLKILILPHVNMMGDAECGQIREWVSRGGTLLATGPSSLVDTSGVLREDFALADVFGVSVAGPPDWKGRTHYLSPTKEGADFFPDHSSTYPVFTTLPCLDIRAREGAEVLATRTLPWPAPDRGRFASIHSDPPWIATEVPEVARNRHHLGQAIYCATPIEKLDGLEATFERLLRALHPEFRLEIQAPMCVEGSLFHQPERGRYVLALGNFQSELPNIPVLGIRVVTRFPEKISGVRSLPDGAAVALERVGLETRFVVPRLETIAMFSLEIEGG